MKLKSSLNNIKKTLDNSNSSIKLNMTTLLNVLVPIILNQSLSKKIDLILLDFIKTIGKREKIRLKVKIYLK